jgi:hypothetical protein
MKNAEISQHQEAAADLLRGAHVMTLEDPESSLEIAQRLAGLFSDEEIAAVGLAGIVIRPNTDSAV